MIKHISQMLRMTTRSEAAMRLFVWPLVRLAACVLPFNMSDLTRCDSIDCVSLEFTSKCSLRCIYCGKSSIQEESNRVFEFQETSIYEVIDVLRRKGLRVIYVSGIGETTTRVGWDRICRSLLDYGLTLRIITNLARPLNFEEASTLARFASVEISIDTCEPDLFAKIRRGARLDTITRNMSLIADQARAKGLSPEFRFDIVVTDKTIFQLERTVQFGLMLGVTDFYFADLYKNPDVKGDFNVYNVASLPASQILQALQALKSAEQIAMDAGCKVSVHPGLVESLRIRLNSSNIVGGKPDFAIGTWGAPGPPKGFTRDCQEPWRYVFLYADGQVRPCCAFDKPIGSLKDKSLGDVLNDEPVRFLRKQLLTGDLHGTMCLTCSMKPLIPVAASTSKIREIRLIEAMKYKLMKFGITL